MPLVPDAETVMEEVSPADSYARHVRQVRAKRAESREQLLAELADLNAAAARNATYMEEAAGFLEAVADAEMPMNAMDVDIRPMAEVAAMQAEWFDALARALKDQHAYVAARDGEVGD